MKKIGLYVKTIILTVLLYGCQIREGESLQYNTEIEIGETEESTHDNAEVENIGIMQIAGMKNKEIDDLLDFESASVSDAGYIITLGTLFEDFKYHEEELQTAVVDNYATIKYVYGAWHDVYFHPYTDLTIYTSDYDPMLYDASGEKIYIVAIELNTSHFFTSRGINIGTAFTELREAYRGVKPIYKEEETNRLIYTYEEGRVKTCFCVDKEREQVTEISLYIW